MFDFNNAPPQFDPYRVYEQRTISKESFFIVRNSSGSHRKNFAENSGLQPLKIPPSFLVYFGESILPIFRNMTGLHLDYSDQGHYPSYSVTLENENEEIIKAWIEEQGHRVFLRDMLFSSIALGMYKDGSFIYTTEGLAFYKLKYRWLEDREELFWGLIDQFCETIKSLPYYKDCKYICAVPPRNGKTFDLPSATVRAIANRLNLINITNNFTYMREKPEVKNASLYEKWDALEQAGLVFDSSRLLPEHLNQDVILIDDLYQSGVTVNFVGMKLQQAGFNRICGLYLVKSMNDRDNVSSRTGS